MYQTANLTVTEEDGRHYRTTTLRTVESRNYVLGHYKSLAEQVLQGDVREHEPALLTRVPRAQGLPRMLLRKHPRQVEPLRPIEHPSRA